MKPSTKNYRSYGAMQDDLSNDEIEKCFRSDLDYVSKNHPEIYRLLVFLRDDSEYIKEDILDLRKTVNSLGEKNES